jgi:tetratricopeptide (TPR) repeat protein
MKLNRSSLLFGALATLALSGPAFAEFEPPRVSPNAAVAQVVGLTDITIKYCRPAVNARVIWGGLVPYDQVWRTGANEATTISFSDEVVIEGKTLAAGTYGLFTIPGKTEWTIILNKSNQQWGAYQYNAADDVLRFKVKPQAGEFTERMLFSFPSVTKDAAEVALAWDKLRVAFAVKVDVVNKALALARQAIADAKPDSTRSLTRAASFCLDNNVNLEEGLAWVEKALSIKETYSTLVLKARYLANAGKKKDAIALGRRALEMNKAAQPPADTSRLDKLMKEWAQ